LVHKNNFFSFQQLLGLSRQIRNRPDLSIFHCSIAGKPMSARGVPYPVALIPYPVKCFHQHPRMHLHFCDRRERRQESGARIGRPIRFRCAERLPFAFRVSHILHPVPRVPNGGANRSPANAPTADRSCKKSRTISRQDGEARRGHCRDPCLTALCALAAWREAFCPSVNFLAPSSDLRRGNLPPEAEFFVACNHS